MTIADVYERDWTTGGPLQRIGLGLLDLIARACVNWNLPECAEAAYSAATGLQEFAGFDYRPSAAVANDPETGMVPTSLAAQVSEITEAYIRWCELTGIPATIAERLIFKTIGVST